MEEFVAAYDAGPTHERIARYRGWFRGRLIGVAITLVLVLVIGFTQRKALGTAAFTVGSVLVVGLSAAAALVLYLLYRRTRGPLATIGTGTALRIDRAGVELAGQPVGWAELTGFAVRPGAWGLSPVLEVTGPRGSVRLPLDQVGAPPASIDSAARAFSGGRRGLDLSALDN